MSEQPTPRTDAVARPGLLTATVTANFARKMERGLCTSASMLGFTDVEIDQLDTVEKLIDAIQKRIAERAEDTDWEQWARNVLTDWKVPFDNHKHGLRLGITQFMRDERAARQQAEARLKIAEQDAAEREIWWNQTIQCCLSKMHEAVSYVAQFSKNNAALAKITEGK